jgi:4-carboxymuconolactone decarboxylase
MTNAVRQNLDLLERLSPGISEHAEDRFRGVFPDLIDHVVSSVYGFAYRRDVLDLRQRQLLTLAILVTLGGCERQLDFQFRGALNLGLSVEEIREVFIQVAVLAGNARATTAARQFHDLLAQIESSRPLEPTPP